MINTTNNSRDSYNRVATIFLSPDKEFFLTGRAPNKDLNDLVGKGHIEYGEAPETALKREVYEELGLDIEDYTVFELDKVPYQKGEMFIYVVPLVSYPEKLECKSSFNWYGRELPEFSQFDWIPLTDWKGKLYRVLERALEPVMSKLTSQVESGLL